VFSVHAVDEDGAMLFRKTGEPGASVADGWRSGPACLIGLEACSGAHEWARRFQAHGHTVRIMAARFVAPYRKSGKQTTAMTPRRSARRSSARRCASFRVKSAEQQAGY